MKIVQAIFIMIFANFIYQAFAGELEEYSEKVYREDDRRYGPLRSYHCLDRKFRNLKCCRGLRYKRRTLNTYTNMYMQPDKNHWRYYSRSKDEIYLKDQALDVILSRIHPFGETTQFRTKRATNEDLYNKEIISNKDVILHRYKRDLPGNPCVKGPAKRTTIVIGLDAITKKQVEILQNPNMNMFQTFFTKSCHESSFQFFVCEPVYTEYMTAVFEDTSFDVKLRPVKVPTSCGMSVR